LQKKIYRKFQRGNFEVKDSKYFLLQFDEKSNIQIYKFSEEYLFIIHPVSCENKNNTIKIISKMFDIINLIRIEDGESEYLDFKKSFDDMNSEWLE
jgi:hypothetical protein